MTDQTRIPPADGSDITATVRARMTFPDGTSPDLMSVLHSSIAARVSYFLDLRGPATMVDTACSSSLWCSPPCWRSTSAT